MVDASADLGVATTILVCNPVPGPDAMEADEVARRSAEAADRAERAGVLGKARTPFLLTSLAEITGGRSLQANLALLEDNARVAGQVAASLAAG